MSTMLLLLLGLSLFPARAQDVAEEAPAVEAAAVDAAAVEAATVEAAAPADPRLVADRLLAAGMARQAYAQLVAAALATADDDDRRRLEREAGALLWSAGLPQDAAAHFVAWSPDLPEARLGLAWSLVLQDLPAPADAVLADLPSPEARYLHGWAALQQQQPRAALQHWSSIPADHPLGPASVALSTEVAAWGRLPYRSPGLAGGLSAVVPGSGQAYVGRWGEAVSALLVNGALIASAVELGRRELWFGMGLAAFFELGFYGGNIVSAVNGARRFNRRAWQDQLAPVQGRYAPRVLPGDRTWVVETPAR